MMNNGSARLRPLTASTSSRKIIGRCEPVAGHDDVGTRHGLPHSVPGHCTPAHVGRKGVRVLGRPARDDDFSHAVAPQMLRRERAGLTRADDEHATSVEAAENLSRKRDGGEADRHRAFTERRLATHALTDAERPVKRLVQQGPRAMPLGRRLERFLHLAEDLRLADDQRVEPGGHPEQVPRRRDVVVRKQVRQEHVLRELMIVAEECDQLFTCARRIAARDIDLGTVARRQHHRFGRRGSRSQRFNGGSDVTAREVEPFAEIDRRRPVTYAEQEQMHWARSSLKRVARRDEVVDGEEVQQHDCEAERRQPGRTPPGPAQCLTREHRE